MLGREINISVNATDGFTSQISLNQRCNSGIYLIIVKTEKEVYYEKVILRDQFGWDNELLTGNVFSQTFSPYKTEAIIYTGFVSDIA